MHQLSRKLFWKYTFNVPHQIMFLGGIWMHVKAVNPKYGVMEPTNPLRREDQQQVPGVLFFTLQKKWVCFSREFNFCFRYNFWETTMMYCVGKSWELCADSTSLKFIRNFFIVMDNAHYHSGPSGEITNTDLEKGSDNCLAVRERNSPHRGIFQSWITVSWHYQYIPKKGARRSH